MCKRCDGWSEQQIYDSQVREIEQRGYAVIAVEGSPQRPGWLYTIGLVERLDHPELVVVGSEAAPALAVIAELVAGIRRGDRLDGATEAATRSGRVRLRPVHPEQIRDGVLAEWGNHYGFAGRHDLRLWALQVLPDDLYCDDHRRQQWDLGRACPLLNDTRGQRARAAQRDQRRKAERRRQRASRRLNARRR